MSVLPNRSVGGDPKPLGFSCAGRLRSSATSPTACDLFLLFPFSNRCAGGDPKPLVFSCVGPRPCSAISPTACATTPTGWLAVAQHSRLLIHPQAASGCFVSPSLAGPLPPVHHQPRVSRFSSLPPPPPPTPPPNPPPLSSFDRSVGGGRKPHAFSSAGPQLSSATSPTACAGMAVAELERWWRSQTARFLLRWPSALLCHITNRVRHNTYGMAVAERVVAATDCLVSPSLVGPLPPAKSPTERWWRSQTARFLLRWPSALLCHITNRVRHNTYGMAVAERVVIATAKQQSILHSTPPNSPESSLPSSATSPTAFDL
ncbi:unnamed protein product [Closterium sp. NIES-54]